jgi:DtxR family Mn-dependent transcriptional regulator
MSKKNSESAENYLEAILILKSEDKVVRVKDISQRVNVSMPSVHTALHVLEERGFIRHEKYGYVELTDKGEREARNIYTTHVLLAEFFTRVLGVPSQIAQKDACRIEHIISSETLDKIGDMTRAVCGKKSGRRQQSWI